MENREFWEPFAADVLAKSGHIDVLVNNAMPLFIGQDGIHHRREYLHRRGHDA